MGLDKFLTLSLPGFSVGACVDCWQHQQFFLQYLKDRNFAKRLQIQDPPGLYHL
jgi:hypothetical protein